MTINRRRFATGVLASVATSLWASSTAAPQGAADSTPARIVVFVGGSIFYRWTNLSRQMAPLPILNRAFDGAMTFDMLRLVDSVAGGRPRVIVYYAGSNDVDAGEPAGDIFDRIRQFMVRVWTASPATRVIFVSINRAPEKQERWPIVDDVNRRVQAYGIEDKRLEYIDVNPLLFDRDGRPRFDLYLPDQLHLRPPAYDAFAQVLKPILTRAFEKP